MARCGRLSSSFMRWRRAGARLTAATKHRSLFRFSRIAVAVGALACAVGPSPRAAPVSGAVTTVIVVRHAEKSTDDPRDPSLSAAGQERTRTLSDVLRDAGVTDIYTTQYKRTRQTAEPFARERGIVMVERPASAANSATYADDLAREILTRSVGKAVLVVGHSNTVPDIVRSLSGRSVPALADADYDRIFIVVIPPSGSPRLMQTRFGRPGA